MKESKTLIHWLMCNKHHNDLREDLADYLGLMLASPEALRGQQLRGGGPVAKFEILLAERTGFPYCLATSSATSALFVAALALKLGGKRIAVESGAWMGSLGVLGSVGAEVVQVPSLLTAPLDSISAVLATDLPGCRHHATNLRERCVEHGIPYIEDTGWLPGITAPVGEPSVADVQVISFGPGKPVSLGEGGALLCRERAIYESAIVLSQHPERAIAEGIELSSHPQLNARIHPIAALLGLSLLSQSGDQGFDG